MARKKPTACKSRRKEKGVPQIRAECPVCTWTTQLTTRENAWAEMWQHQHQLHHFAPVRQVEDSEERVAEDTHNQEAGPVFRNGNTVPVFRNDNTAPAVITDPKPVDTTQPILQEVVTQQVPGTQQPEYRHEQLVVEDHAASQDKVGLLSMDGDHRRVCHMACQVECDAEPCPKVRQQYPLWLRWEYCTHKCYCPDCQCQR